MIEHDNLDPAYRSLKENRAPRLERQASLRERQELEDSLLNVWVPSTTALWAIGVIAFNTYILHSGTTGNWWSILFVALAPMGVGAAFLWRRRSSREGFARHSNRLRNSRHAVGYIEMARRGEELLRDERQPLLSVSSAAETTWTTALMWAVLLSPSWLFGSWQTFFMLWIVLFPLSTVVALQSDREGRRALLIDELEAVEECYGGVAKDHERRLRKQEEAEATLKRDQAASQAYREEVERFHRERLGLEQSVVGDEVAGIRSPYQVEMTPAETALLETIASRFDPSCLLVDTYLDKGDGTTTQIDIIAICRQGVIVIESKGIGGTISGKSDDKEWIQQPSQRRIYNPIRQNDLHMEAILRALGPTGTKVEEDSDDIL